MAHVDLGRAGLPRRTMDPDTRAVLRGPDELDAGRFEGSLNGTDVHGGTTWNTVLGLHSLYGPDADAASFRKLKDTYFESGTRGADLGSCKH